MAEAAVFVQAVGRNVCVKATQLCMFMADMLLKHFDQLTADRGMADSFENASFCYIYVFLAIYK